MTKYQILVFDDNDRIIETEMIEAEDDQMAKEMFPNRAPIYGETVSHADNPTVGLYRVNKNADVIQLVLVGFSSARELVLLATV